MEKYPKFQAKICVTNQLDSELNRIISTYSSDKIFIITDTHCQKHCLPQLANIDRFSKIKQIIIAADEENKTLLSVEKIWFYLSQNGADRKSLVINLGGGMVTDLGSFAASTFKRGCNFVNIPTTLLAQVDASVGGKTGFNFNGLKNEIGVINQPFEVIIDTRFLHTIDHQNFLSGFAEIIKHGLIYSIDHLTEARDFDLENIDFDHLTGIIARSVAIKDYFVAKDPDEKNIRKALNFGHTVGHAFESFAMAANSPILHGYAVAYGMIVELYLSYKFCGLPIDSLQNITSWITTIYGKFEIKVDAFEALYELMTHDKKNEGKRVNFTLIPKIGEFLIDQNCSKEAVFEALNYYRNINI